MKRSLFLFHFPVVDKEQFDAAGRDASVLITDVTEGGRPYSSLSASPLGVTRDSMRRPNGPSSSSRAGAAGSNTLSPSTSNGGSHIVTMETSKGVGKRVISYCCDSAGEEDNDNPLGGNQRVHITYERGNCEEEMENSSQVCG